MSLVVEPIWAWWWVATAAVVVLGIVLWTYPPRVAHLAPRVRRTLLSLRLFAAVLLILMLLRPTALFSKTDKQPAVIIFLLDNSRSMTIADGGAGATRRQAMIQSFEKNQLLLKKLRDQVEVRLAEPPPEVLAESNFFRNPRGHFSKMNYPSREAIRQSFGMSCPYPPPHGANRPCRPVAWTPPGQHLCPHLRTRNRCSRSSARAD